MDDPSDFDFNSKKNARSARTGRRAQQKPDPVPDTVEDDGVAEEDNLATMPTPAKDHDAPPRPSRRVSGWGDEMIKRAKGKLRVRRRGNEDLEDMTGMMTLESETGERLRPQSPSKSDDSDNDIPVIPDLEDQQEEDMTTQIAMAPNVAVNRVATYRELDNDLLRHAAFLTLDNDIDLKLLTRNLSSEGDVLEEDKPWYWDRLFTEVSSELSSEWEVKTSSEPSDSEKT